MARVVVTHMSDPLLIPANPMPEMARPAMKTFDVCATAEITLPTSKMAIAHIYTHFKEKSW
jgi:hypothetical protein